MALTKLVRLAFCFSTKYRKANISLCLNCLYIVSFTHTTGDILPNLILGTVQRADNSYEVFLITTLHITLLNNYFYLFGIKDKHFAHGRQKMFFVLLGKSESR